MTTSAPMNIDISKDTEFRPSSCGVIIGATKCGTTSLYRALAAHPFICPSNQKELNVFLEAETSPQNFTDYMRHFKPNPYIHKVTLEASPQYTHYPRFSGVAERMANSKIPFKLIYIVRDPYERLESHYRNGLGEGFLTAGPSEWLDRYGVMASDYSEQLKHFEAQFPRTDILVLSFDMVVNSQKLAHSFILKHLGLPTGMILGQRHENRGEAFIFERAKQLSDDEDDTHQPDDSLVSVARSEARIPPSVRLQLKIEWSAGMSDLYKNYSIDITKWGFSVNGNALHNFNLDETIESRESETKTVPIIECDCPADWRPHLKEPKEALLQNTWPEARLPWASGDLMTGRLYGKVADKTPIPKFSIIIASYKRPDLLKNILKALRLVRQTASLCEVLAIIDGDAHPDYPLLATEFRDVALFVRLSENRGPGTARNVGATLSSGDFLVFLDDDCVPEADHLEQLIAKLRVSPNLIAVGGPTKGLTETPSDLYEAFSLDTGINPKPGYHKGRLICLPSCNLAVRRDWFLALNGFDPLLRASEDFNLTYRLKAQKALVLDDPDWSIQHDQNWGLSGILKRARRDGYWLSKHANQENDTMASDILPSPHFDALRRDLILSLKWRWHSWKGMPLSKRISYFMIEVLRQIWRWRGVRDFYFGSDSEQNKESNRAAFTPETS